MVASTDIKFYVHTNNNAPQLQNAYGSMINVLDAFLVDGIFVGDVLSLTVSSQTATVTVNQNHNLLAYQVVKITGANQTILNGEHRIVSIENSSVFKFELPEDVGSLVGTGVITCSLPPLGWEKPFSSENPNGGGKAAYRSSNILLMDRPYLRVVDELNPAYATTYSKYAKVGIVENMTDIDTMLGTQSPFNAASPDKNWVATGSGVSAIDGWARWYYARAYEIVASNSPDTDNVNAGNRSYVIVGNSDFFYIINGHTQADANGLIYGFGAVVSPDQPFYLSSTLNSISASASNIPSYFTPLSSGNSSTAKICMIRSYNGSPLSIIAGKCVGIAPTQTSFHSGTSNTYSATNIVYSDVVCIDADSVVRGVFPSLKWVYQAKPHTNKELFLTSEGRILLPVDVFSYNQNGQVVFDLGEYNVD